MSASIITEISNSRDFDVVIDAGEGTHTYFITRYWNENSDAVWYDQSCRVDGKETTEEIRNKCIKEIDVYLAKSVT